MQAAEADVDAARAVVIGDAIGALGRRDVDGHCHEVGLVVPVQRVDVLVDELDLVVRIEVAGEPCEPERWEQRVFDAPIPRRVSLQKLRQDQLDAHADQSRGLYRWCSMRSLPSGSVKNAMWQTPVSNVSPVNSMPFASSSARAAATSSTCSARCAFFWGANGRPCCSGSQMPQHVSPTQNSKCPFGSGRSPSVST